jgi:hypothetical protein
VTRMVSSRMEPIGCGCIATTLFSSKEWVCRDHILEYAASLMNRPTLSSTDATDVGGASSDRRDLITSVTNVILC